MSLASADLRLAALDVEHRLADPTLAPLERQLRESLLQKLRIEIARARLREERHAKVFCATPVAGLYLVGAAAEPRAYKSRAAAALGLSIAVAHPGEPVRFTRRTADSLRVTLSRVVEEIARIDAPLADLLALEPRRIGPGAHITTENGVPTLRWFAPPGITVRARQAVVPFSGDGLALF